MRALMHRLSHLGRDGGRKGAHWLEEGMRNHRRISRYHHYRHRLSDGPAHSQHDCSQDPRGRTGYYDSIDGLPAGGTESQGGLPVSAGNGSQGVFR